MLLEKFINYLMKVLWIGGCFLGSRVKVVDVELLFDPFVLVAVVFYWGSVKC